MSRSEPVCVECQAILEELQSAGMLATPQLRDRQEIVDLMNGEGVDELLARFPFRPQVAGPALPPVQRYPGLSRLFRRILDHKTRTGHNAINPFRR